MEWIVGVFVVLFIIGLFSSGSSSSSGNGSRKFRCDSCGSNQWIVTDQSYYDNVSSISYNYKEWLKCAKCGNTMTNEKRV